MTQPKWLDRYSGQTASELLALEDEYRVDSLIVAFEQAIDQKAARVGTEKLTREEMMVLAIEGLEREVNNGGYSQFFINSSREYVPMIVDSLVSIKCPRTAEITQMAIDALKVSSLAPEQVEAAMAKDDEDRDAKLEEYTQMYFSASEAIAEDLFEFIKKHRGSYSVGR